MTEKQDGRSPRSGEGIPRMPGNGSAERNRRGNLSEISQALRKDADMVCSESLPERILDNIRKQLDGKKKRPKRKRMMARPGLIRLALMAVGLVLFLALAVTSKKKEPTEKPLRPDRTGAGPSYAEFIVRPTPKSQQYRTQAAFSSSVSPLELRFHGDYFWVFDGVDVFRLTPPGVISGRTTQLWTSRSFSAAELKNHLTELCGELRIGERKISRVGNALIFSAKLKERQAAVLVKQLAAWGLIPVSRSGPLPDRDLYLGAGGGDVSFVMTVLMKDRGGTGLFSREERDLFLGQGDTAGSPR